MARFQQIRRARAAAFGGRSVRNQHGSDGFSEAHLVVVRVWPHSPVEFSGDLPAAARR